MITCHIKVSFHGSAPAVEFTGIYPSTFDANMDAGDTYPNAARVEVKAL